MLRVAIGLLKDSSPCRSLLPQPILALLALWVAVLAAGLPTDASATIGIPYQMLLGNPSGAIADTNNHNHYLIQREVQALDYSDNLRQPNWASWHYTPTDSGSSGRSSSFYQDTNLPPNFTPVYSTALSGSGYDRGHMCPSADRTDTVEHNDQTFYMSNIIPQSPDNNQGVWANLETYSRAIAASNEVLVICGPQGFGANVTASSGAVPIASNVWKIIVAVPLGGGTTLSRVSNSTRVIAVSIPNVQGVRNDPWQNYLTSVNQLQTNTGFNFFTSLNSNLATVLRAKVDGAARAGITNLSPLTGAVGSSVVIRGTNFTGVTTVWFNGTSASFTLNSSSQITAIVPSGATSGPVSVVTAGGLATSSANFSPVVPIVPSPTLGISASAGSVTLWWPTNASGFVLEQTLSAQSPNWVNVVSTVTVQGTNFVSTFAPTNPATYYRLSHP